ncbi:MAG: hypothetical protein JWO36_7032 [Myxococcales bacterium]|nr:hypothetical protein [Myxococcales bacterium]
MSTEEPTGTEQPQQDTRAEDLTDELAKKYDPERLLKILARRAGRGEALEHSVRARYEQRLGVDLGHVRVYSGEFAEEFNRQRNAYAVTIGATGMILMGNSPDRSIGSTAGQALLAHELTHVAQQARGFHRKASFDGGMPFAEEHEAEAEAIEQEVMASAKHQQSAQEQQAAKAASGKASGVDIKEQIEKIKARVLEMFGDAARTQYIRNGSARRA